MSGGWTPGIGDPSALGWFTVIAYLVGAWLCLSAAGGDPAGGRTTRLWRLIAMTLLLLGLNKQLDLQTLLTQVGRAVAQHQGWYGERLALQAAFILAMALTGAIAVGVMWRRIRVLRCNIRYALAGLIFIFTYVLIRASSFHHVDIFIKSRVCGVKWSWIIEISGIAIVWIAAWRERHDMLVQRRRSG